MKSKKLLSVLLAVLMLAVLFPAAALGNAEALPEDEDPSLKAEPFTLEPGPMPALEAQQAPAPSKDDIPMKGINESINDKAVDDRSGKRIHAQGRETVGLLLS